VKIPKGVICSPNRKRTDNTTTKGVKIPKGVICSLNRRRTDNTMTKSVKIPKGLSVVRIEDGQTIQQPKV
jgi:hypothetical protein